MLVSASDHEMEDAQKTSQRAADRSGAETILIVDDRPSGGSSDQQKADLYEGHVREGLVTQPAIAGFNPGPPASESDTLPPRTAESRVNAKASSRMVGDPRGALVPSTRDSSRDGARRLRSTRTMGTSGQELRSDPRTPDRPRLPIAEDDTIPSAPRRNTVCEGARPVRRVDRDGVNVRKSVRSPGPEDASEAQGGVIFREITARWSSER